MIKIIDSLFFSIIVFINLNIIYDEFVLWKIKNKYLVRFLIVSILYNIFQYFFIGYPAINYLFSILYIFIICLLLFIVSVYWIWSFSYLKYIFVILVLFSFNSMQFSYTGNLFILIFAYMIISTIWFYLFWFINKNYRQLLIKHFFGVIKNKSYLKEIKILNLIRYTVEFIILFILIRILRGLIMPIFLNEAYRIHDAAIIMFSILFITIILRYINQFFRILIKKHIKLFYALFCLLTIYFVYLQIYDKKSLYLTISMLKYWAIIYVVFYVIRNSFFFAQWIIGSKIIKYWELKEWDNIDKEFLRKVLSDYEPSKKELNEHINSINSKLGSEDIEKINNYFKKCLAEAKNKNLRNFNPIFDVKVYDDFKIWIFIFITYLITYITELNIIKEVFNYFLIKR